jgi:hypothetical protein
MSRHPEPASVIHYRATLKAEPPMVCHTCDWYTKDGICSEFGEAPPEAFASEPGECSLWVEAVPF